MPGCLSGRTMETKDTSEAYIRSVADKTADRGTGQRGRARRPVSARARPVVMLGPIGKACFLQRSQDGVARAG